MIKKKLLTSLLLTAIIAILNVHCVFGQEWEQLDLPENLGAYDLHFFNSEIYLGTTNGIYFSQDNFNTWELLGLQLYNVKAIIKTSQNKLIVGATGRIFKYLGNHEWQLLYVHNEPIECFLEDNNGNLYFGSWGYICRSTDGGETWNIVLAKYNTEVIRAIDENSEGLLFAGSTSFTGNEGGVYRSENNGETWEPIGLDYHFVSSLVINSYSDIFVGTRGHWQYGGGRIFKSLDPMGNSWEIKLENNLIADMVINEYNTLFVGCSAEGYPGGVFCSYDNGDTWNDLSSDLPTRYIENVFISPNNYLYVVIYPSDNLYRLSNPILDIILESEQKLKTYPNPTGNHIAIEFPKKGKYVLELIDLDGKILRKYNTQIEKKSFTFSLDCFPKGLYFIKVYNKKNIHIEKVIKY